MARSDVSLAYRADIDGLRSFAIGSVVVFHAFPRMLHAGFVGVDVFFVISGYLISSLILRHHDKASFSLAGFYRNRVRRLFPGLVVVLSTTLVAAGFILFPPDFGRFGWHLLSSVLFFQNITLWRESGYFDLASQTKPLLHLWSLAVEEQFYLVWPVLLVALRRRTPRLLAVIGILSIVSLGWNVWQYSSDSSGVFFLPYGRFWEFLVGAAVAVADSGAVKPRTGRTAWLLSLSGCALLLFGLAVIDDQSSLHGFWQVPPVVGTGLLIAATSNGPVNRLLKMWGFVYVGRISYVWYLWHWPALALLAVAMADDAPAVGWRIVVVVLSFVAASATYHFVEVPIRSGLFSRRRMVMLVGLLLTLGAAGWGVDAGHGLRGMGLHDPDQEAFAMYFDNNRPQMNYFRLTDHHRAFREDCNFIDIDALALGRPAGRSEIARSCTTRDPTKAHALLIWGDSHAQHLRYGLSHNLPQDWQVLQVASSVCRPAIEEQTPSPNEYCARSNRLAAATIASVRPDVVVMAHQAGHDPEGMRHLAETVIQLGAGRVVYAGPAPVWRSNLPAIVLRRMWPNIPRRSFKGVDLRQLDRARSIAAGFVSSDQIVYADIAGTLCDRSGCLVYLGDDPITGLVSWDYGHLTSSASDYVARELLRRLILGG